MALSTSDSQKAQLQRLRISERSKDLFTQTLLPGKHICSLQLIALGKVICHNVWKSSLTLLKT